MKLILPGKFLVGWLASVISAFCMGGVHVQTPGLSDDDRLDRPITLSLANASLKDCAKNLSILVGTPILVNSDILDRKATLMVTGRKAHEVMEGLADCLMLGWQKDSQGYRLYLPKETRDLEKAQLEHERTYARKGLLSWANRLSPLAGMSTPEIEESLQRDRLKIRHQALILSEKEKEGIQLKLAEVTPFAVAVADVVLQKGAVGLLLEGKSVFASGEPVDRWFALKLGLMPQSYMNGTKIEVVDSQARIRFLVSKNQISVSHIGKDARGEDLRWPFYNFKALDLEPRSPGPLEERLARLCAEPLNEDSTPLAPPQRAFPNPGYRSNLATLAEHLSHLSNCAKVDIIADGYRRAVSIARPASGATVGDYLKAFRSENAVPQNRFYPANYVRSKSGFLMIRHSNFWNLQLEEVPERVLHPIEERIAKRGYSTIEDYATVASQVTDGQMAAFEVDSNALFRFSKLPIFQCSGVLRLWSLLNQSQKDAAYSKEGLMFANLQGSQREAARLSLMELIWKLPLPREQLHSYIQDKFNLNLHGIRLGLSDRQPLQDPEYTPFESNMPSALWIPAHRFNFHFAIPGMTSVSVGAWLDRVSEAK